MVDHYGAEQGNRMARKHIGWYSSGLHGSAEFRSNINKLSDASTTRKMVEDFYGKFI
jgi:tRNA-dihydrouridine synthase B